MEAGAAIRERDPDVPGPYAGDEGGELAFRHLHRPWRAVGHWPAGYMEALDLLARYRVLTAWLLRHLTAFRHPDRVLRWWWERGWVDRHEAGHWAPVWTLSRSGSVALRAWAFPDDAGEWDTLSLLRGVCCSTFAVWLWKSHGIGDWEAGAGEYRHGGATYRVLAPRLWPGETVWARDRVQGAPRGSRLVVVCSGRGQAEELARVVKGAEAEWRVTWDGRVWRALSGGDEPVLLRVWRGRLVGT